METPLVKRDGSKYYQFHQDYDNKIEDCRNLKEKIERHTSETPRVVHLKSVGNSHLDLKGQ